MFNYHQNLADHFPSLDQESPCAISHTARLINSMSLCSDDDAAAGSSNQRESMDGTDNQSSSRMTIEPRLDLKSRINGASADDLSVLNKDKTDQFEYKLNMKVQKPHHLKSSRDLKERGRIAQQRRAYRT